MKSIVLIDLIHLEFFVSILQTLFVFVVSVLLLFVIVILFVAYTKGCFDSFPSFGDSSSSSTIEDSSGGGSSSDSSSDGNSSGSDHLHGDATLGRVSLTGYRLENGVLVPFTSNEPVDFSNLTSENLFGIREGESIVPGCKFIATMELTNTSKNTLDYWMEIRMPEEYFNLALAQQLKVKLTVNGREYSTVVGDTMGDQRAPIGQLAKGESVTFTISVEFVDSKDNNEAQGQTISFDLYVNTARVA